MDINSRDINYSISENWIIFRFWQSQKLDFEIFDAVVRYTGARKRDNMKEIQQIYDNLKIIFNFPDLPFCIFISCHVLISVLLVHVSAAPFKMLGPDK